MYRVTQIPAKQKEDEPERNEENAYNKAPDQNARKDFQIAHETRRFIHFFLLSGFSKEERYLLQIHKNQMNREIFNPSEVTNPYI